MGKLGLTLLIILSIIYFTAFAQQTQRRAASPSPSPQTTPTVAAPNEQPKELRAEDKNTLLAEYQLADRVQDRVIKNFKVYGTILGLALAVVGFIGFAVIQDIISRRVMEVVKKDIEKDVETIRIRIQTALADLQISLAESKIIADRSHTQLEELKKSHSELEDLSSRYENLHKDVIGITERVESALAKANESERKTEGLRDAVANSLAGRPSILGYGFNGEQSGSIQGTNFGDSPGKVYFRFFGGIMRSGMVIFEKKWEMPEFEISGSLINVWKDDYIEYHLPTGYSTLIKHFQGKVQEAIQNTHPEQLNQKGFRYSYRVETANWAVSEEADKWNVDVPSAEPLL